MSDYTNNLNDLMLAGTLRELLEDIPDDMPICIVGHYGEAYEVYTEGSIQKVRVHDGDYGNKKMIDALIFHADDIGPEPD